MDYYRRVEVLHITYSDQPTYLWNSFRARATMGVGAAWLYRSQRPSKAYKDNGWDYGTLTGTGGDLENDPYPESNIDGRLEGCKLKGGS